MVNNPGIDNSKNSQTSIKQPFIERPPSIKRPHIKVPKYFYYKLSLYITIYHLYWVATATKRGPKWCFLSIFASINLLLFSTVQMN